MADCEDTFKQQFIEDLKVYREDCIRHGHWTKNDKQRFMDMKLVETKRKNFMKPAKNLSVRGYKLCENCGPCKMNTKDKNLWITGTKEKLEKFIQDAIGDDEYQVYNKKNGKLWNGYFNQPFIVFRIYDKRHRNENVYEIRCAGDWGPRVISTSGHGKYLYPDLFHAIVLSTMTPKEYCEGMLKGDDEAGGIEWRYDVLQI